MQTQPQKQNSFPSQNNPPPQQNQEQLSNTSGLTLALPNSSSKIRGVSHAMPGGVSHSTTTSSAAGAGISQGLGIGGGTHTLLGGGSHALLGGSHVLLGGVSHAMPLASSAAPGYPFSSSSAPPLLESGCGLPKIKLVDILPEDGPPTGVYTRAVEELSGCLSRHGAAIMELGGEDAALVRCALESATLYFRTRAQSAQWSGGGWSKTAGYVPSSSRDMYYYRAGRGEEVEVPPPCMSDVFRCLGKASRVALGAISRHLRLRSDAFYSLLDDCPLPDDSASSSVLVATRFHEIGPNSKASNGPVGGLQEYEKGFLTLIAADSPGLQVCDANGQWYLADMGLRAGDLLILTGRSLQHVTSGVCHAYAYRIDPLASSSGPTSNGRTSLTFRLMPRSNEMLDGSMMADVGYSVPERYGPVLVSKFLESLHVTDAMAGNRVESPLLQETNRGHLKSEPTLRSLLSDPLTGAILEDAYTSLGCGHSFGGGTFKKVMETQRCSTCGVSVNLERVIPNHALRAAAAAFKQDEMRRQHHNTSRKRRKEAGEHGEKLKKLKELPGSPSSYDGSHHIKGVQYPFNVNEKVVIKGNKRTPEKFVGREAVVTSKCLNGWYLLRTLDNGESVRLQYRSLKACTPDTSSNGVNEQPTQPQTVAEMTS